MVPPETIGLLLDNITDYVVTRISADKAWEKVLEGESYSHYCGGHCEACSGRERCEEIRAKIIELLSAKTS